MSVLLHIGYIKSGSTYLQHWFEKHPAMLYKYNALGGFSNTEDLSWYAQREEPMHECYVISSELLSVWPGNADVVGMRSGIQGYDVKQYQQKLCDMLHALYPTGKVLIVTRGYTTLFSSMYAQYVFNGGTYNFQEFFKSMTGSTPHLFDYSHIVRLYRERFGKSNVIVLPYELLRDNPEGFTATVERELEIQHTFTFTKEKINAMRSKKVLKAHLTVSNMLYKAVQPLPYKARKMVYGLYMKQNYAGKLKWVFNVVAKVQNKEIDLGDVSGQVHIFEGRAELLRTESLYQPYLKEYLL